MIFTSEGLKARSIISVLNQPLGQARVQLCSECQHLDVQMLVTTQSAPARHIVFTVRQCTSVMWLDVFSFDTYLLPCKCSLQVLMFCKGSVLQTILQRSLALSERAVQSDRLLPWSIASALRCVCCQKAVSVCRGCPDGSIDLSCLDLTLLTAVAMALIPIKPDLCQCSFLRQSGNYMLQSAH